MKNNLLFDFTVNKASNTVYVNREFAAPRQLVWDTFTQPELLDQWWAPKPWSSKTKHMSFAEGGRRFYAMVSPDGEEHWAIQDFTSVTPISNFKFRDAFSDKDENLNSQLPSSEWNLDFTEDGAITMVKIEIVHQTLKDLETIIEMGFKEGFTMTLNYLDELLNNTSKAQ